MEHPNPSQKQMHTILFASPKQGGIVQSSGFLDLRSLMALSQTCKAHALDELSLILLIENEMTRNHKCHTMEEAIAFWRMVCEYDDYQFYYLLKEWLQRDTTATDAEPIVATVAMLLDAITLGCDVMLGKMLRTIPQSQHLPMMRELEAEGHFLLHCAANSGNVESLKIILSLYPESEWLRVANERDNSRGRSALHCAAESGNLHCIRTLLDLYPESERFQAVLVTSNLGETVLYCAAKSGIVECFQFILSLYPESGWLQVVSTEDKFNRTAESSNLDMLKFILSSRPASQRLRVLSMKDREGRSALHHAAIAGDIGCLKTMIAFYTESERLQALCLKDQTGRAVLHFLARSRKPESIEYILQLLPESECLKIESMQDNKGRTVLYHTAISDDHEIVNYIIDLLLG